VSDGRIRREVLVASLLIAIGIFVCVMVYLAVSIQINVLVLGGVDVRGSFSNLAALLTLLAVGCLFLGVISGFLIGKHRRT
jgi:hypothetical protein